MGTDVAHVSAQSADSTADANFQKSDPDAFEYLEQLGAGSFGKVFKVRHIATGEVYAMKTLQRTKLESGNLMRYAITERNVMSQVKHPYIVSLRYAFQTENQFVLVMTYCSGGNLQQLLKSEKRLQLGITRHYGAETLLALTYLHEHKILYRDLKPENVVLDDDRHAMITDFGLSKEAVQGTLAKSSGQDGHPRRSVSSSRIVSASGLALRLWGARYFAPWQPTRRTMWPSSRRVLPGLHLLPRAGDPRPEGSRPHRRHLRPRGRRAQHANGSASVLRLQSQDDVGEYPESSARVTRLHSGRCRSVHRGDHASHAVREAWR